MYQYHNAHTYHQDDTVLGDRSPMIPTFVGKRAGGTKYLDDRDQTKKQEIIQITLSPLNKSFIRSIIYIP